MRVDGVWYRTIWLKEDGLVQIIDQRHLPHDFVVEDISTVDEMAAAIKDMHVRGAGLIGCAAAYGMYLAVCAWMQKSGERAADELREHLRDAGAQLRATRPTAVNLSVGVARVENAVAAALTKASSGQAEAAALAAAKEEAKRVTDEDAEACRKIGEAGADIIAKLWEEKKVAGKAGDAATGRVNVLTHCNAGWLAFADWGSALSPVYAAFDRGVPVHVWVDETRPRNQGAALTAWELGRHGVPHTVIADNAGGHLMRSGLVDMCITGSDRTTRGGDVCNKIGTYLKALAAKDNGLPFYVALPSSTIDWEMEDGAEIPIEERGAEEVRYAEGRCSVDGKRRRVLLTPEASPAGNWAFDVTPRRLVTGLITERGLASASSEALKVAFPEHAKF